MHCDVHGPQRPTGRMYDEKKSARRSHTLSDIIINSTIIMTGFVKYCTWEIICGAANPIREYHHHNWYLSDNHNIINR